MSNKIQDIVHLAGSTASKVTKTYEDWTGYLMTASRLSKYPFTDQLLIYAQRPDATACASFDIWRKRLNRYVKRGSKGIALVDVQNGRPSLRYVFDVTDTGEKRDSRNIYLWQYKDEHREAVTKALGERFGRFGENGLIDQLESIAAGLAGDYWNDHHSDVMYGLAGSTLEGMDELNVSLRFRAVVGNSIAFTLMSRCGLHPERHFKIEDFQNVCDFDTQQLVKIIGTVISEASGEVLQQISKAILDYERQKHAARPHPDTTSGSEDTKASPELPVSAGSDRFSRPSVREIYEQYKPIVKEFILSDTAYLNACKNSDKENAVLEGVEAVKRAALAIKDLDLMRLYYDLNAFHMRLQREIVDETYPVLSVVQKTDETGTEAVQEDGTQEPEPAMEAIAEPAAAVCQPGLGPAGHSQGAQIVEYQVGDIVYLDNTSYEIVSIDLFDVTLRDPSQAYPIDRVENKERLKDALERDQRNKKEPTPDTEEPIRMEIEGR